MIEDEGVFREDAPIVINCAPGDVNNSFQRCIYDRDSRIIEDFRDGRIPSEVPVTDESRMMSKEDRLTEVD